MTSLEYALDNYLFKLIGKIEMKDPKNASLQCMRHKVKWDFLDLHHQSLAARFYLIKADAIRKQPSLILDLGDSFRVTLR
jgi:hypothetical protein